MRNLYAKKCCWCKVVVQAGEGKCWNYNGRWYVGCQSCIDSMFNEKNNQKKEKGDQFPYFFLPIRFRHGKNHA